MKRNGTASFLHSREGVKQGDSIAMIAYRIEIIPLIKKLKREIPDVTQPWYADDAGALGVFAILETYFDSLTCHSPGQEYHPEPIKSVLIVRPENLETVKLFRACHGFRLCRGSRYLGGYIGHNKSKHDWMRERTLTWEKNISTISKTARKCPQ